MDARTARIRFKVRPLTNFLLVIAIFIPLVSLFSAYWFSFLIDLALIAVLGFLFFFVLERRPIKLTCPHCLKTIETNTPWICGFKGCENQQPDNFPFVY